MLDQPNRDKEMQGLFPNLRKDKKSFEGFKHLQEKVSTKSTKAWSTS